MKEPLNCAAAKALIKRILSEGHPIVFTKHGLEQMAARAFTAVDVVNVLRAGVVKPGEVESGTWRYRVETFRMAVVIAFRSETQLVVVTVIRFKAQGWV